MLLTIGITTLNRGSYLNRTLDYILSETQRFRENREIEIIVIDNGSSDNTQDVLQSYIGQAGFYLKKNSITLPVYESVCNVLDFSLGEYFWCFGDDDLVPRGYISDLLDILKSSTSGLICIDRKDFYEESEIDLSHKSIEVCTFQIDKVITKFNAYDRLFGFLTSIVYRRDLIADVFKSDKQLLANNYINKYVCWCTAISRGITMVYGPIAYKRCSIGEGSHFQSSLDIRVKTFIYDQAKVAGLLAEIDLNIGDTAYKKYLGSYREFLKYKRDGANLHHIKTVLRKGGVPSQYLNALKKACLTPVLVIRLADFIFKIKRHAQKIVS